MRSVYPNRKRLLSNTKENKPTNVVPQDSSVPTKKPRSYRECFYPAQVVPPPSTSVIFSRRSTLQHERRECSVRGASKPSAFGRQLSYSPSPQKRTAATATATATSPGPSAIHTKPKKEEVSPEPWRHRSASAMGSGTSFLMMQKSRATSCTRGTSPPPAAAAPPAAPPPPPPMTMVDQAPSLRFALPPAEERGSRRSTCADAAPLRPTLRPSQVPAAAAVTTTSVSMELSEISCSSAAGHSHSGCWKAEIEEAWEVKEQGDHAEENEVHRSEAGTQSDLRLLLRASPIRKHKETQASFLTPHEATRRAVASLGFPVTHRHEAVPHRRWTDLSLDATKLEPESGNSRLSSAPPSPPIHPTPGGWKAAQRGKWAAKLDAPAVTGPPLSSPPPPCGAPLVEQVPASVVAPAILSRKAPAPSHAVDSSRVSRVIDPPHHHASSPCDRALVRSPPPSTEIVCVEAVDVVEEALAAPTPCTASTSCSASFRLDEEENVISEGSLYEAPERPVTAPVEMADSPHAGQGTSLENSPEARCLKEEGEGERERTVAEQEEKAGHGKAPIHHVVQVAEKSQREDREHVNVVSLNEEAAAAGSIFAKEGIPVEMEEERRRSSLSSSGLPRDETRQKLRFDPSLFIFVANPREYVQEANFRLAFASIT